MTKPPTAAQRRIIEAADPATGRLTGSEAQLTALVRHRLAFRHPRPPHAYFLTPTGHRIREGAHAQEAADSAPPPPQAVPSGLFAARTGAEPAPPPGAEIPAARARDVRSAWEGLLEMRRMTNPDGARGRPCTWERTHLVQAAALALEAAGCPPGPGDGYGVAETPQPEAVAVRERSPERLRACAAALEAAGWQVSEHAERPHGVRYLLASPRRS